MPNDNGRIEPVSFHGIKNAWLDSLRHAPRPPRTTRAEFIAGLLRDVPPVRVVDLEAGDGVPALGGSPTFRCPVSDDECAAGCDWPLCEP